MNETKTFDEVVALNLDRLLGDRNISVTDLASALDVSRAQVYDMLGPRKGRRQREFKWSELVQLCDALMTNIPELVLPPEGVTVAFIEPIGREDGVQVWKAIVTGDRADISKRLFGVPAPTPEALRQLHLKAQSTAERREIALREASEALARLLAEEE